MINNIFSLLRKITKKGPVLLAAPFKRPGSQQNKWILQILLLTALVLLIELTISWATLLKPWKTIGSEAAFAAILLLIFSYLVRALRLTLFFEEIPLQRFTRCLRISLIHNFYNNLLPMRSGELSFLILMQKEFAISYKQSTAALVWLRMLDLMAILLIAAFTLFFAIRIELLSIIIALSTVILPLWLAAGFDLIATWMEKRKPGWQEHISEIRRGWPDEKRKIWESWIWTLINWVIKLSAFAVVFHWFIDVDWYQALFAVVGAELTSVLPFHSVAGAGSYESGALLGLSVLGEFSTAAVIAAVNLHLFIIGMTLVSGLLAMNIRRNKASGTLKTEDLENDHESH
jgi:uncharacterized membrane protein YbhN (UPF0104 family)